VIDLNNDCLDPGCAIAATGVDITPLRAILPAVDRLLRGAREASIDVIYTTADLPESETELEAWFDTAEKKIEELRTKGEIQIGQEFVDVMRTTYRGAEPYALRIVEEIAPQDGDVVVRKLTEDGFNSQAFVDVVTRDQYDYLVFAGVATDMCLMSTARSAAERGFKCALISDATATFEQEGQTAAERLFAAIFGEVWTTEEALGQFASAAEAGPPAGVDAETPFTLSSLRA
jgi:nicotinamidase-related amidase